jgi:hypothetical protein
VALGRDQKRCDSICEMLQFQIASQPIPAGPFEILRKSSLRPKLQNTARGNKGARVAVRRLLSIRTLILGCRIGHSSQFNLLSESSAQQGELTNEVPAYGDQGILRGDSTVCLASDEDLRHVRVSHCDKISGKGYGKDRSGVQRVPYSCIRPSRHFYAS